jgi:hypothetical protein
MRPTHYLGIKLPEGSYSYFPWLNVSLDIVGQATKGFSALGLLLFTTLC